LCLALVFEHENTYSVSMVDADNEARPPAARFELGSQLRALAGQTKLTPPQIAAELRVTDVTVRRYFRGDQTPPYATFKLLLDLLSERLPGGLDRRTRSYLEELQAQGDSDVWYSRWRLSDRLAKLLDLEYAATDVAIFELALVPGPLQTAEYARQIIAAVEPDAESEWIDQRVAVRLERQRRTYESERAPRLRTVITEHTLRASPLPEDDAWREQLLYLSRSPFGCDIRVLPDSVRAHPGLTGSFWIFGFASGSRPPAVYTEGSVASVYRTDPKSVDTARRSYDLLSTLALDRLKSSELILQIARELDK
jgi:transcriptional regulator with XRE-family HTH domain